MFYSTPKLARSGEKVDNIFATIDGTLLLGAMYRMG